MLSSDALADGEIRVGTLLTHATLPILEARALLAHQLQVAREHLIARPEQRVAPADASSFELLVARRQRGEPLAYLLGEKEFYGRTFGVSPAVLIPRPETELLIETALSLDVRAEAHVLDLGTGSGCVAITLGLERPAWHVTATDVSPEAIGVARTNAATLHASSVSFRLGSWLAAAPAQQFDLIVSNPPYVAESDVHLQALRFEPQTALAADDGGLACLRDIIEASPPHLVAGGLLVLEHGHNQAAAVRGLLGSVSWRDVRTLRDQAGIERVTLARTGPV